MPRIDQILAQMQWEAAVRASRIHLHYILADDWKTPIPVDLETWAHWFEASGKRRRMARTEVGDLTVSTVFLSMNHSFDPDRPILFETQVMKDRKGQLSQPPQYSTYEEAIAGHNEVVASFMLIPKDAG